MSDFKTKRVSVATIKRVAQEIMETELPIGKWVIFNDDLGRVPCNVKVFRFSAQKTNIVIFNCLEPFFIHDCFWTRKMLQRELLKIR